LNLDSYCRVGLAQEVARVGGYPGSGFQAGNDFGSGRDTGRPSRSAEDLLGERPDPEYVRLDFPRSYWSGYGRSYLLRRSEHGRRLKHRCLNERRVAMDCRLGWSRGLGLVRGKGETGRLGGRNAVGTHA